jgi:hypothetical protein
MDEYSVYFRRNFLTVIIEDVGNYDLCTLTRQETTNLRSDTP